MSLNDKDFALGGEYADFRTETDGITFAIMGIR